MLRPLVSLFYLTLLFMSCDSGSSASDDAPEGSVNRTANLQGTGDSANDILANTRFTELQIEIAYVNGFRPDPVAIGQFRTFLEENTFKERISFIYTPLPSPDEESLSLQEIDDLERENRTIYTNGDTLAVYIYFADAPADDDEEEEGLVTLGAVYRNTSMVLHERTIRRLASGSILVSNADVEAATLNHEFGHLMGLVNLGDDTVVVNPSHEDEEAPNHCNVTGCLMRAELQFRASPSGKGKSAATTGYTKGMRPGCVLTGQSVLEMFSSKTGRSVEPPTLQNECLLDLEANGGRSPGGI